MISKHKLKKSEHFSASYNRNLKIEETEEEKFKKKQAYFDKICKSGKIGHGRNRNNTVTQSLNPDSFFDESVQIIDQKEELREPEVIKYADSILAMEKLDSIHITRDNTRSNGLKALGREFQRMARVGAEPKDPDYLLDIYLDEKAKELEKKREEELSEIERKRQQVIRADELRKINEQFGCEQSQSFSEKKLFQQFLETQINPYLDMKKSFSIKGALVKQQYIVKPTVRQRKKNEARETETNQAELRLEKRMKSLELAEKAAKQAKNTNVNQTSAFQSQRSSQGSILSTESRKGEKTTQGGLQSKRQSTTMQLDLSPFKRSVDSRLNVEEIEPATSERASEINDHEQALQRFQTQMQILQQSPFLRNNSQLSLAALRNAESTDNFINDQTLTGYGAVTKSMNFKSPIRMHDQLNIPKNNATQLAQIKGRYDNQHNNPRQSRNINSLQTKSCLTTKNKNNTSQRYVSPRPPKKLSPQESLQEYVEDHQQFFKLPPVGQESKGTKRQNPFNKVLNKTLITAMSDSQLPSVNQQEEQGDSMPRITLQRDPSIEFIPDSQHQFNPNDSSLSIGAELQGDFNNSQYAVQGTLTQRDIQFLQGTDISMLQQSQEFSKNRLSPKGNGSPKNFSLTNRNRVVLPEIIEQHAGSAPKKAKAPIRFKEPRMSTQLKRAIALSTTKKQYGRRNSKVSPAREKLNEVMSLIQDFKGHDIMQSNIQKTDILIQANMMEDRFRSQMTLDTASMIQQQSQYNPKIVKWLFEETIICKNSEFHEQKDLLDAFYRQKLDVNYNDLIYKAAGKQRLKAKRKRVLNGQLYKEANIDL